MEIQAKLFKIPQLTIDAAKNINQLQERLIGNARGISAIMKSNKSFFSQINSLQSALSGISRQIATIASENNQWDLLDEFENITEQAIEITSNISAEVALTEEESVRFEQLIQTILLFLKRNKAFGVNALLFLTVVVSLMNAHQYYDFVKTKPEAATKQDLERFERKMIKVIESRLKEQKEFRTTNRVSKVMLKPKTKTILITSLPKGFDVIVLQINHKWAFVSYTNPKDNLSETGWIMKKYLDKN